MVAGITDKRPIGIFDSGIGGLTVAGAIHKALPNEDLIYFGDTAHLPYGDKSPALIRKWSKRIASFLVDKNVKMIVIACNTASAAAYQTLLKHVPHDIPIVNVITPTAKYVANKYDKKKIGVIGTKGTISSRVYVRKINKFNPKLKITSQATPLLAPMIEEGYFNNNISKAIIYSYLDKPAFKNIAALILGCTHYPMIKKEVKSFYDGATEVIDSAEMVSKRVKEVLVKKKLLRTEKHQPKHRFFISDYTESFASSTKIFFKGNISLKKKNLWVD